MVIVFSLLSLLILILTLDTAGKIADHYLKISNKFIITLGFIVVLAIYFVVSTVAILMSLSMMVVFILYNITLVAIFVKGYMLRNHIAFLRPAMPIKYVLVALAGYLGYVFFNTIEVDGLERFDIVFYYPLISATFDPQLMDVTFGRILAEVPVTVTTLNDAVLYTFQSYYYVLGYFQKMSTMPSVAFVHYIFAYVYIYIFTEMLFFFSRPYDKKKFVIPIIIVIIIAYMTNPITTMYFFLGSQYVIFIFALIYYALIHLNKTSFTIGLIWGLAFFSTVSSALFLMPLVLMMLLIVMVLENDKQHLNFIYGISLATFIGMSLMLGAMASYKLWAVLTLVIAIILGIAHLLLKITVPRKVSNAIYVLLALSTLITRFVFADRILNSVDAIIWFVFFTYLIYGTKDKYFLLKVLFVHSFILGNVPLIQYIASLQTEFDVLQRTFFFSPGRAFYQIVITYLIFALAFKKSYKYFLIAVIYFAISVQTPQAMLYNMRFLHTILNDHTHKMYFQDKTRVDIIQQLDAFDPSIDKTIAAPFRARLISIDNEVVFTRDWIDWDHRFVYENIFLMDEPDRMDDAIKYLLRTTDYLIIETERATLINSLNEFDVILQNEEFSVYRIRK